MQDDIYYDRAELLEAQSAPEYQSSPRYRDEVAAKLQRSMAAGTVSAMTEEFTHQERSRPVDYFFEEEGLYGVGVQMPGPPPYWAAAAQVNNGGTFSSLEEVALAMDAPVCEIDPTYRLALREKIDRSIRAGTLPADVFNRAPR